MRILILSLFIFTGFTAFAQKTIEDYKVDGEVISRQLAEKHLKEGKIYIVTGGLQAFHPFINHCERKARKKFNYSHYVIAGCDLFVEGLLDSIKTYNEVTKNYLVNKYGEDWEAQVEKTTEECLLNFPCIENPQDVEQHITSAMTLYFDSAETALSLKSKCLIDSVYFPILSDFLDEMPEGGINIKAFYSGSDSLIAWQRMENCKAEFISLGIPEHRFCLDLEESTGKLNTDNKDESRKVRIGVCVIEETKIKIKKKNKH